MRPPGSRFVLAPLLIAAAGLVGWGEADDPGGRGTCPDTPPKSSYEVNVGNRATYVQASLSQVYELSPLSSVDVGDNSRPVLADFDGDGDMDLLVFHKGSGTVTHNPVYYESA